VIDVDPSISIDLVLSASLAGLATKWAQGPYVADYTGQLVVRLDIPPEAFLDNAALDYLTGVRVTLVGSTDGHKVFDTRAPGVFLAWPFGEAAGPVVWDKATAATNAPNGIVSELVRASFGTLPSNVWVRPPIGTTRPVATDEE
jgi:hypothetical protein